MVALNTQFKENAAVVCNVVSLLHLLYFRIVNCHGARISAVKFFILLLVTGEHDVECFGVLVKCGAEGCDIVTARLH